MTFQRVLAAEVVAALQDPFFKFSTKLNLPALHQTNATSLNFVASFRKPHVVASLVSSCFATPASFWSSWFPSRAFVFLAPKAQGKATSLPSRVLQHHTKGSLSLGSPRLPLDLHLSLLYNQ